jgi:hypothetical protein
MKTKIVNTLLVVVLGVVSCTPKMYPTSEVQYIASKGGTINLSSYGYASKQRDAYTNAEKEIFKVIIYKGLPETIIEYPMVKDKQILGGHQKAFLNDFFKRGIYKDYIISTTVIEEFNRHKPSRSKRLRLELKINLRGMQRRFEKEGVIKKFGL